MKLEAKRIHITKNVQHDYTKIAQETKQKHMDEYVISIRFSSCKKKVSLPKSELYQGTRSVAAPSITLYLASSQS